MELLLAELVDERGDHLGQRPRRVRVEHRREMPCHRPWHHVGTRREVLALLDPQPAELAHALVQHTPSGVVRVEPQLLYLRQRGRLRRWLLISGGEVACRDRNPLRLQTHHAVVHDDAPEEQKDLRSRAAVGRTVGAG